MDASLVLAEIFGGLFVFTGLSALNRRYLISVIEEMSRNKALVWLTGFVTFGIGLASLSVYSAWPDNWRVIITLIGWLMLIKGAYIALAPDTSMRFYRKMISETLLSVVGVVAIIIGLVLFYLAA